MSVCLLPTNLAPLRNPNADARSVCGSCPVCCVLFISVLQFRVCNAATIVANEEMNYWMGISSVGLYITRHNVRHVGEEDMRDGHLPGCPASPWRQLLQLQTSLVIYADILNCQTGQQSLPAALARHTGMSIMNNAIYSVHQFPYTSLTGVRRSCQLLQQLPRLPSTPCTPQQSPHAQRHAKPIMYNARWRTEIRIPHIDNSRG